MAMPEGSTSEEKSKDEEGQLSGGKSSDKETGGSQKAKVNVMLQIPAERLATGPLHAYLNTISANWHKKCEKGRLEAVTTPVKAKGIWRMK